MRLLRLAALASSVLLAACPSDRRGGGSDPTASSMGGDPKTDPSGDPTSPGLEPPNTGEPGRDPTDTPGVPGASGMGGGGMGGSPAQPPPVQPPTTTDPDTDAGTSACGASCGVTIPCPAPLHCIVVPSCGQNATCIEPQDACLLECGTTSCALLESYPEQIRCD